MQIHFPVKKLTAAVLSALVLNHATAHITTAEQAETITDMIAETAAETAADTAAKPVYFNRTASFLACTQFAADCNDDTETSAEIVYVNKAGDTLVYSDSPAKRLGLVDISDLHNPVAKKSLELGGEPTSVTLKDNLALVVINTAENYVNVSGELQVYDLDSLNKIATLDLGGQPDSIAISPDGNYAVVAIENERDEDLNDGVIPQMPAGFVVIIDTADADPTKWTTRTVDVSGLATIAGEDPEPEYVDINSDNIAVVSLQENNALVLIDIVKGEVVKHFDAGSVDLDNIDLTEGKPKQIAMVESKTAIPREPDGVSWIDNHYFATANEGDYKGGSRGFSIFNTNGEVVWDSGNSIDHMAVRLGHYPDKRSGNKGSEPENVEVATFGNSRLLFVNAERAGLVFVYNVNDPKNPQFKQALPTGVGPEGAYAIPARNALVVASEVDSRKDKMRSVITIYEYGNDTPAYPTLVSADKDGLPVSWSALSGLAADADDAAVLYAIEDSFFKANRIFTIDASKQPAVITNALPITDSKGLFAGMKTVNTDKLINDDKTVNIDPEGISVAADGGFWIASEGKGTVGDKKKPFVYQNLLIKTNANAEIEDVITLPASLNSVQLRFGFEGVAEHNGLVYVAFQRAWNKEDNPRIGIYNPADRTWRFVFYPLDAVASPNGGWVGLSDLTSAGNGQFWVLERDNQGGPDAAVKRIYRIDLSAVKGGETVEKTLIRDLMDDLKAANGTVPEKVEGLALSKDGNVYIVNDNDGVDDNSGETQLIKVMQQ